MKKILLFISVVLCCAAVSSVHALNRPIRSTGPTVPSSVDEFEIPEHLIKTDYDQSLDYQNPDVPTDFFMLVYSHAPSFCEKKRTIREGKEHRTELHEVPLQCVVPNRFGWVIHGLWGESREAYLKGKGDKHPRFCRGDLPKVHIKILKPYLCMSPSTTLLQGEWEKHGSCDFKTPELYFGRTYELYKRFKVPPADLTGKRAIDWMKANNPELHDKWLHLYGDEFGICFDTDFNLISCPK